MKLKLYLLIILANFLLTSCKETKPDEIVNADLSSDKNNIPKVKTTTVKIGVFNKELFANGKVSAHEKAEIVFVLEEIITDVYVKNGQKVKANQILAIQSKEKYVDEVKKAKEQFEKAKIDVEDILLGFGYSLKDSIENRIPERIMKIAKNRANYHSTLSSLRDARRKLLATELRAPFDGLVANISNKKHTYPDTPNPFCILINNKILEIEFSILGSNYFFVSKDQEILISRVNDSTKLKGVVSEINPTVDENGMIKIKGIVTNPDNLLLDGMNVRLIINKSIPNSMFIPKECVVVRDGKKVVFSYKDGKAIWNYVDTSYENSEYIIITKGLNRNDKVICSNNINLAHKSDVELVGINE